MKIADSTKLLTLTIIVILNANPFRHFS